jgi:hypothetical protein
MSGKDRNNGLTGAERNGELVRGIVRPDHGGAIMAERPLAPTVSNQPSGSQGRARAGCIVIGAASARAGVRPRPVSA